MENLILLAVFGVIALGKWLLENAGKPPEDSGNPDEPTHRQSIPPRGDSEEERMRRFMEALGLPANEEAPPARPAAPAAERRVEERRVEERRFEERRFEEQVPPMIERRVEEPPRQPAPAPARRIRPPRETPMGGPNPWGGHKPRPRPARPVPAPPRPEPVFTAAPPAPAPVFRTPSETVEATTVSMESVAPQMEIASFGKASESKPSSGSLMSNLRDPKALRDAFVLREILGPPKALQPL